MTFTLNNICKRFGEEYAVQGVSATIGSGMNFLTGASGSGKTTLLKILSGMEPDFDGSARYLGQELKKLSADEKSALWSKEFGFIWQDFNLLDHCTVLENVLLPQYLQKDTDKNTAMKILRELKISKLASQKAGKLSGGEKQRAAIARELMKNPSVIFADEPTSALDAQSSHIIIEILRSLSKKRTVIVVTHDTSLIGPHDKVYELDKGELILAPAAIKEKSKTPFSGKSLRLSIKNTFALGMTALRRHIWRSAVTALSLVAAGMLLLISVSGTVSNEGKEAFDKLFATYGDSLLDISLVSSFISAGGTDGQELDEPNANVNQELDGLFEKYCDDSRVEHALFAQAFNEIEVTVDDREYAVESSNNMPVINHLLAGSLPMGNENEVAVPESFVKTLGLTNDQIIGKQISFSATVNNWESGEPVQTPVSTRAKVVGVIDTALVTEYDGEFFKTPINDSFFFSPAALRAMRKTAELSGDPGNFYLRAKTPEDLISLKDELNAAGIVPLGYFELVEDIVRLDQQTTQQSSFAVVLISVLALFLALAAAVLNAVLRRREYAIFKISGFSGVHLMQTTLAETVLLSAGAVLLFLAASPLLDLASTALWKISILDSSMLLYGSALTFVTGLVTWAATAAVAISVKTAAALKTGDR